MKNGFWNYTQPITYRHVLVRILPVSAPGLHWQNAFAGKEIEALEIAYEPETIHLDPMPEKVDRYIFYIDNQDGLGILKIQRGGGPDSGSRHISVDSMEILRELSDVEATHAFSPSHHLEVEHKIDHWQKTNHPAEYQKLKALRAAWEKEGDKR
jgi:hypothetical protein